jgi:site-specific DNA-cytosine methylase
MKIRYVDLCCGIGGFRVGINEFQKRHPDHEFECIFSADIKDGAILTYDANFGTKIGRATVQIVFN